jgi:hypothetical protein
VFEEKSEHRPSKIGRAIVMMVMTPGDGGHKRKV